MVDFKEIVEKVVTLDNPTYGLTRSLPKLRFKYLINFVEE